MLFKNIFRNWILKVFGGAAVALAPMLVEAEYHIEQHSRPPVSGEVCDVVRTPTTPPPVDSLHRAVWNGQNWLIVPRLGAMDR
jgi:hypothetical protein